MDHRIPYKIWKRDVTNYWVQKPNGELESHSNLLLFNCRLMVDIQKYDVARQNNFVNSNDPFDYFAWIEASSMVYNPHNSLWLFDKELYYNPHKSTYFKDRDSESILKKADFISTVGNILYYHNENI